MDRQLHPHSPHLVQLCLQLLALPLRRLQLCVGLPQGVLRRLQLPPERLGGLAPTRLGPSMRQPAGYRSCRTQSHWSRYLFADYTTTQIRQQELGQQARYNQSVCKVGVKSRAPPTLATQ